MPRTRPSGLTRHRQRKWLEGPALSGPRSRRVTAVTRATLKKNRIFMEVPQDLFKLATANENGSLGG
ncbi:MAG TPA: hypothetical protein VMW38_24675 [Terriglobia bacterium]|nr:hypothetical protein [Terriglobia bacterium]